jgi:aminoglycoside phosphotransferase (APT) family kinase protein
VKSLTKVNLAGAEIDALATRAFGSSAKVVEASLADEGWFNAGYRLVLSGAGPSRAFLKVAPPSDAPVLTYEFQLMRAEAAALQALAQARVPHLPSVLATDFSHQIVSSDCLFMTWIEGVMFSDARAEMAEADRVSVRRQIGAVCGAANRVEAEAFGYPAQPRLQATAWRAAFARMVSAALADALRYEASLPAPADVLAAAFEKADALLDVVVRPRLTHFDLWDKNVMVRRGPRGWELSGVLDWERGFYGDPLADVISQTIAGSAEERAAAMQGSAEGRGEAHSMDREDQRRLALYRAYLWLVMIAEAPSRGFVGSIRLPSSSAGQRLLRDLERAGS